MPFPSPGDLPNPGIEPRSPALQADSLLTVLLGKDLYFLLAVSHSLHAISAQIRDRNRSMAEKAPSPNHWTTRKLPNQTLKAIIGLENSLVA